MGDRKTEKKSRTILVLVLSFLLIVIAVLVATVIMKNQGEVLEEVEEAVETGYVLPDELLGEDLSAIDQVTKKASLILHDPNKTKSDVENYYDTAIEEAKNNQDDNLALEIMVQKMNFIAMIEGDCERAATYINNIDLTSYPAEGKSFLAPYVVSVAIECDNQELQKQWENF
ncbi:MAG: hypothetical protein K6G49_02530 [Candidatus Saccharibacteria bacterium]|nr:hypothetical protein [Candidatus Saccharibacteria bacterium]